MSSVIRSIVTALSRLRGGAIEVTNAGYEWQVDQINRREKAYNSKTDEELEQHAAEMRKRIRDSAAFEDVLLDAFTLVREAARRTVGMRPFDVQVLAALAMHDGKLVEMQTGEGKTLAAVLPACLRAFLGCGVHVLTFNDYLAARDAAWMGPVYRFLDLSVGHVAQGMAADERRSAYRCDVTYVTAKEAGFDFLRDQLCLEPAKLLQRGYYYAIVDEADSILIDEARVPLVLAGAADDERDSLYRLAEIVRTLRRGVDYSMTAGWRNVNFESEGLDRLQRELHCGELHAEKNVELLTRLNMALHAEVLLRRDVDYLVRDGEIALIDELTGRVADNRRWPYGLQAALEAKEGVAIQPQGKILHSITLQHFMGQYECLSGMTGTAQEAAEEFFEFYNLKVVVVPPNRPCIRNDQLDRVFPTKKAKNQALVREIAASHRSGRPVLVGTASVAESERLAALLDQAGVACRVLNARNDSQEAALVAEAGMAGAVTISTNMAGRGTDIRLGGLDERDREQVIGLGGLLVLGTNRHESRRIDNQLRGRAGRQGDPGESCFFISVEDDLIHRHGIDDLIAGPWTSSSADMIDDPRVGKAIAHVQRVIEGESFEIRRTLRKYSFCLERHRRLMHEHRLKLIGGVEPAILLREKDPDWYEKLRKEFGQEVVEKVERQLMLCQIDRCWSDYLAHVAEVREGIYLVSMGGLNAFDEFNRQINEAFREMDQRINEEVLAKFRTVRITAAGVDLDKEGLLGPSSTWTYMINDNPMGDVLERLSRGLKRLVKRLK